VGGVQRGRSEVGAPSCTRGAFCRGSRVAGAQGGKAQRGRPEQVTHAGKQWVSEQSLHAWDSGDMQLHARGAVKRWGGEECTRRNCRHRDAKRDHKR
jgi:hypothetical protein